MSDLKDKFEKEQETDKNAVDDMKNDLTQEELSEKNQSTTTADQTVQEPAKSELDELKAKNQELNERYLRLYAEYENFRKRTLREKMDLVKVAGEEVILGLLPVIDNFERAQNAVKSAKDIDAVKEGIDLIYNKFKDFLATKGVKEIEAVNLDFNADLHEAITKIPAPNENLKGKVVDVVEKGYYLHDKIIRYSKVVVGE